MNSIRLSILALCFALLHSCKYAATYETVNADNKFTLSIPSWLKKEDNLAPGAQFQYANRFRNFYAIGFAEPKADSLGFEEMMEKNIPQLKSTLSNPLVTDSTAINYNGATGVRMEIWGKMTDESIYFSEVYLETAKGLYHLSVWTRGDERKLKFKSEIDRILESFKEL